MRFKLGLTLGVVAATVLSLFPDLPPVVGVVSSCFVSLVWIWEG